MVNVFPIYAFTLIFYLTYSTPNTFNEYALIFMVHSLFPYHIQGYSYNQPSFNWTSFTIYWYHLRRDMDSRKQPSFVHKTLLVQLCTLSFMLFPILKNHIAECSMFSCLHKISISIHMCLNLFSHCWATISSRVDLDLCIIVQYWDCE